MRTGEIWIVNFSPSVGDEIGKARPAVIVNDDEMGGLALRIVVPITASIRHVQPWHIKISPSRSNGLKKESIVDAFQLKSISENRFTKKIGIVSSKELDEIKVCIVKVLDLA
jgi:mRNA interferase MazF